MVHIRLPLDKRKEEKSSVEIQRLLSFTGFDSMFRAEPLHRQAFILAETCSQSLEIDC